jgi:hypothetical protein
MLYGLPAVVSFLVGRAVGRHPIRRRSVGQYIVIVIDSLRMDTAKDCMYAECSSPPEVVHILNSMGLTDEAKIRVYFAGTPDRKRYYKLFEHLVAYKFRAILWENIPALVKKSRGLPRLDSGVDCVSSDLTHVIQAKWYKPDGKPVPHTDVSTFFTLGTTVMHATKFTLVTSEGVTLGPLCPPNIDHVIVDNVEFVETLVMFQQGAEAQYREMCHRSGHPSIPPSIPCGKVFSYVTRILRMMTIPQLEILIAETATAMPASNEIDATNIQEMINILATARVSSLSLRVASSPQCE